MKPALYEHQRRIIEAMPRRIALVHDTGTGKSRTWIEMANKALGENSAARALLVCPKGLRFNWRQNELAKYADEPGRFDVMTKEEFRRDAAGLPRYAVVGVDEAHHFFGRTSAMSKALVSFVRHTGPDYLTLMTATPYRSSPWDIYRMAEILGYRLNYMDFVKTFFYEVNMGGRAILMPRNNISDKLSEVVARFASIVRMDQVVDVPEQVFETEYFALSPDQKRELKALVEPMAATRFVREHQITGGTLKGNEYEPDRTFACDKADRVVELALENDRMVVVCRYNLELEHLRGLIKAAGRDDVEVIYGETKPEDRHRIVENTKTANRYVILVNAAVGEGWRAATCSLMVFYSYSFELLHYVQMKGRIQEAANIKSNTYLSLVTKGEIDEHVYHTIVVKRMDFQNHIYDRGRLSDEIQQVGEVPLDGGAGGVRAQDNEGDDPPF